MFLYASSTDTEGQGAWEKERVIEMLGNFMGSIKISGSGFNPFRGKTPQEINQRFLDKGFIPRGPDPINGKGGYVNPKTGRSYHIDFGNRFNERSHVDVNRPNSCDLPKKKYFIGD